MKLRQLLTLGCPPNRPPLKDRTGETGVVRDIAVQATGGALADGAFRGGVRAMPWEGRDRLDLSGYPKMSMAVRALAERVELRTPAVTVEVRAPQPSCACPRVCIPQPVPEGVPEPALWGPRV